MHKPYKGRLFHAVLAFERNSIKHKRLIGLPYPIIPKASIINARQRCARITSRVVSVQNTWEPNTYIVETENSIYRVRGLKLGFKRVYPFGLQYIGVEFVHTLELHQWGNKPLPKCSFFGGIL